MSNNLLGVLALFVGFLWFGLFLLRIFIKTPEEMYIESVENILKKSSDEKQEDK